MAIPIASIAAGAHTLFNYNRSNYMFDREMRQKQEFKVWEFRKVQAELWRDDVRDIVGLTEKKMDAYLIISVLSVGMCVALFTEGRLEPGTPPWLLHFFMLNLAAAFMYMLMSVWFSMHATVVAKCTETRLLTQFVRLPVPTMEQLHDIRTYGISYEGVGVSNMFRVPFTTSAKPYLDPELRRARAEASPPLDAGRSSGAFSQDEQPLDPERTTDPWHLEPDEEMRSIYELEEVPACNRRHISLARQAASQYQGYDAFARVSMTFGANQLLHAIAYYSLGYLSIQDGATWPAWTVVAIMTAMTMVLIQLDFSLTKMQHLVGQVLVISTYTSASYATYLYVTHSKEEAKDRLESVLPLSYATHAFWLLWALVVCGIVETPNGSLLPMKLRAVLYLDVFGWNTAAPARPKKNNRVPEGQLNVGSTTRGSQGLSRNDEPASEARLIEFQRAISDDIAFWRAPEVQRVLDPRDRKTIDELAKRFQEKSRTLRGRLSCGDAQDGDLEAQRKPGSPQRHVIKVNDTSDAGTQVSYLYDPVTEQAHAITSQDVPEDRRLRTIASFRDRVDQFAEEAAIFRSFKRPEPVIDHTAVPLGLVMCGPREQTSVEDEDEIEGLGKNPSVTFHEGPAGEVHIVPQGMTPQDAAMMHDEEPVEDAFKPETYVPAFGFSKEKHSTGHNKFQPQQLPAKLFRLATCLLIVLWIVGLVVPYAILKEFVPNPLVSDIIIEQLDEEGEETEQEIDAQVGTDPNGLPELVPASPNYADLPMLTNGERLTVGWPSHAAFVPRALTCDVSGTRLIVSDDFGVYSGRIEKRQSRSSNGITFKRVSLCVALEGKALEDTDVACGVGEDAPCILVALTERGSQMTSCRVDLTRYSPVSAKHHRSIGNSAWGSSSVPTTWYIAGDWLQGKRSAKGGGERINAVSANSACLSFAGNALAFDPSRLGCLNVGTSTGRVVKLTAAETKKDTLIPGRIIHQKGKASGQGSLSIFRNFLLKLEQGEGARVDVFNMKKNVLVGQWRLPDDTHWLMLCGGGDTIFALGVQGGKHVVIFQFKMPEELVLGKIAPLADAAASFSRSSEI